MKSGWIFIHSLRVYFFKIDFFRSTAMKVNHWIAALDWNSQNHAAPVIEKPSQVDVVKTRRSSSFVLKRRAKRRLFHSAATESLMRRVVDVVRRRVSLPPVETPALHNRMSKTDKPSKDSVMKAHRSRMPKPVRISDSETE